MAAVRFRKQVSDRSEQHQAGSVEKSASNSAPEISVVMPVHNALPFLDESVGSILKQSFTDFEFVILDDASTDGSDAALKEWAQKDSRIRLFHSERKLGLSGSSNFVVANARAPLIARMDSDDVSHRERLMRQWEAMRACPDVVLLGTLCEGIDAAGRCVRPRDRWRVLRRSMFPPFPHGSVMFRRRAFDEAGGYREECAGWEDQELFLRMAERGGAAVLSDALYLYRYHLNSTSVAALESSTKSNDDLQQRCLVARRAGRDYAQLLERAEPLTTRGPSLSLLRSIGAMRLWAGHAPSILGPVFKRTINQRSFASLMILGWAAWASLSPGSLKSLTYILVRARDRWASRRLQDGRVYRWRLG